MAVQCNNRLRGRNVMVLFYELAVIAGTCRLKVKVPAVTLDCGGGGGSDYK